MVNKYLPLTLVSCLGKGNNVILYAWTYYPSYLSLPDISVIEESCIPLAVTERQLLYPEKMNSWDSVLP